MLWNLFAKNPFRALQELMKEVLCCTDKTKELFVALRSGNQEQVADIAKQISQLEHHCDELKREIRTQLSKSIFLPVDRRDLLHVLSNMDALADICEDLGVLLTLRKMELPPKMRDSFNELLSRSLTVVHKSNHIIMSLDRLLETGFSGPDAIEILKKIDE